MEVIDFELTDNEKNFIMNTLVDIDNFINIIFVNYIRDSKKYENVRIVKKEYDKIMPKMLEMKWKSKKDLLQFSKNIIFFLKSSQEKNDEMSGFIDMVTYTCLANSNKSLIYQKIDYIKLVTSQINHFDCPVTSYSKNLNILLNENIINIIMNSDDKTKMMARILGIIDESKNDIQIIEKITNIDDKFDEVNSDETLLSGNYEFTNIYDVVYNLMLDIGSNIDIGSERDFARLKKLLKFDKLPKSEQLDFIDYIRMIDVQQNTTTPKQIKQILNTIDIFYKYIPTKSKAVIITPNFEEIKRNRGI